ncbi:MAG: glycosyltransferase [Proteobacteria bacterium]|nr:glycosyltransferase [Pseudomonadota bacterium]
MRVMQCMAGAKHGGAEAFFTRMVLALHRAGLDQRVVLRPEPVREKLLADGGIAAFPLAFGGKLDLSTRLGLRRELARFKPDVVLSWMSRAATFCPKPAGRFIHCGRLGGYYDLKYYRTCDHLIGNTEGIVNYLIEQGWPANRAHYLPNFVAPATEEPMPRQALSTPDDAAVVLALGRLHPNKAFDILIQAMRRLPDVYLWLAGDGPLEAVLRQQAVHFGVAPRIRFLGWREDPGALYAGADLVVCPSRIEPLGNVVLEAWARRKPIVAAAADGPSTLIRDGENGLLVPVDDVEALAAGINQVLANREAAQTMAEAAFADYMAEYSETVVVQRYLDFFHKVADQNQGAPT